MADSKAWAHIEATWPDFASNPRNVRLALATDGFNPFGDMVDLASIIIELQPPALVGDQTVFHDIMFDHSRPTKYENGQL